MKKSKIAIALYVVAGIMGIIFLVMLFSSINYVKTYCQSYGVTMSDMGSDAYTYILTNSITYLIYGILIFAAGYIVAGINALKGEKACTAQAPVVVEPAPVAVAETPAAPVVPTAPIAESSWSMDKVPQLYTSKSFTK